MKSCLYCVHFRFSTLGQVVATCSDGDIKASNRFQKALAHSHVDETDVRLALSEAENCNEYDPIDEDDCDW